MWLLSELNVVESEVVSEVMSMWLSELNVRLLPGSSCQRKRFNGEKGQSPNCNVIELTLFV